MIDVVAVAELNYLVDDTDFIVNSVGCFSEIELNKVFLLSLALSSAACRELTRRGLKVDNKRNSSPKELLNTSGVGKGRSHLQVGLINDPYDCKDTTNNTTNNNMADEGTKSLEPQFQGGVTEEVVN